jgi:hypothetical protein
MEPYDEKDRLSVAAIEQAQHGQQQQQAKEDVQVPAGRFVYVLLFSTLKTIYKQSSQ